MPPRRTLFERMGDLARAGAERKAIADALKRAAYAAMPDPSESARFASMVDQLGGQRPRLDPLPMPRRAPDEDD